MARFEVSYGPDWFDSIRMGLVNEITMHFPDRQPESNDKLIINCLVNGLCIEKIEAHVTSAVPHHAMPNRYLLHIHVSDRYKFKPEFSNSEPPAPRNEQERRDALKQRITKLKPPHRRG